jgi:hypothetical protein
MHLEHEVKVHSKHDSGQQILPLKTNPTLQSEQTEESVHFLHFEWQAIQLPFEFL